MTLADSLRPRLLLVAAATVTLLLGSGSPAIAQRFLPDDPLWRDRDDLPIDEPGEIELNTPYDVIEHTFFVRRPRPGTIRPAQNVNTLGEVPDSSWFTNRIGVRAMSLEEIVRGPNRGDGPDFGAKWEVIRGKAGGITPGFTMRDSRGDVYFVKFDPPAHFGLSTGADVIGSKFFHAMGYFVPENWIVYFTDDQVRVASGAKMRVRGRKPQMMTDANLRAMLREVARLPDGRIRAVMSRAVPGKPLGPHKYHGTRPDDPNDVIPHEDRRELRGYRVFSAWLNHDDSRSLNSLNSYVKSGSKGYLVHYLQDFSSAFGSGSDWRRMIAPQNPRAGNEYVVEIAPLAKTLFTLGIWQRPWHEVRYEVYPQVGAIEADFFDPDLWKPEYPNPAFDRMLPEDAAWAARIVARFTDEFVRAIVREGDFRAPEAEGHLVSMLLRRRDKILDRYLCLSNPLGDFRLEKGALAFTNHGEDAKRATVEGYEVEWSAFDNQEGTTASLGPPSLTRDRFLPLPADAADYVMARIRTISPAAPAWSRRVDVFVRTTGTPAVVGVERE
jgi:hypothetical protein